MQLSVTITSLGGPLVIQDPHPVQGVFSKTVPANGAKTFTCNWDIWHRISAQVESYRAAGLCTVALTELTPTGTDGTSGANTTYSRPDWALLNSFRKDINAIVDDHIFMTVTGLDMKTDEIELSAALSGAAGKRFLATHLLIKSSVNVGALTANGTINVGTAANGAQIASGVVLTGIGAVGTARMVPLAAHAVPVAGNATLYVNVESPETGAGTLKIDVTVVGRQI